MTEGARQRGSPPEKGDPPEKEDGGGGGEGGGGGGGDDGGGVALKKEIGLLSACGIIVVRPAPPGRNSNPRGDAPPHPPPGSARGHGVRSRRDGDDVTGRQHHRLGDLRVLENAGCVGLALLVWGATGAVTAVGALCYAELGVTIPRSGGDYAYVKEIFGGLAGFLRLWIAVLVIYPTNQAVIALTFANYVLHPLFPDCPAPEPGLRLLAAACLLLLTWVNCASVRWATRVQDVFTAGKLLALALIIGTGIFQICKGEHFWLAPRQAFSFWQPPAAGRVALAFLQGSFAYGGWNFLNYVTEELVDPYRNLPRAIFISIPLVTFVYVFANVAYVTAMSPQELLDSNAVAVVSERPPPPPPGAGRHAPFWPRPATPFVPAVPSPQTFGQKVLGVMAWVMPLAVALSTFGGVNGSLFTCSRLFYAGAREGHLPALLAMIHVERRTPIPALLVTCVSTLLMLVTGDIYTLINYVGFVNYLWYGVTVAGLVALRWRQPRRPRPIRVSLCFPALYLLFWAALLLFSLWSEPLVCGIGLGIMATGAPLYLLGVRGGPRPPALRRAMGQRGSWGALGGGVRCAAGRWGMGLWGGGVVV
ncbi:hypothetical protein QYF61_010249 [Mycteria americana]|uniref:Solute carrier family 7 member 10 n=1 Tax=Mycteria americana TaxID=33587 RepID=A0AAN7RJE8_MYCAM|nr:hypothetical protein QYF61_010249 [Mycteria americana]